MTDTVRRERVLAVDPGKTTGIALIERVRDASQGIDTLELLYTGETDPDTTIPVLRSLYERHWEPQNGPRMRVLIESFLITVKTGEKSQEASWALRTTGAVEQMCRDFGYPVDAIAWQKPSQKGAFPNKVLKSSGMWHVGGGGHALDAIRHGLVYFVSTGGRPASTVP